MGLTVVLSGELSVGLSGVLMGVLLGVASPWFAVGEIFAACRAELFHLIVVAFCVWFDVLLV